MLSNISESSGINPDLNSTAATTILITGGTGLVGLHLIKQLMKEGKKVKALYRSHIPDISGKENITWVKGDILDVIALNEAMRGIEQVYHCAAIVSFNAKRKQELFKTNIEGTANVVNAAVHAGAKKFCFVSSVAALGKNKKKSEINETMNWTEESNDSNYSKSKHYAEVEVWRGIAEGLKAVIVNPSIILGGGNWNDSSTKIFKTAYEEFPWYAEGITGFVDVHDVVKAMIQLMDSDVSDERFILSAENRKYKEIFTAIANAFGKRPPHKKVTSFIANVVWRFEALKSKFTGEEPLLTKETANAAQSEVLFDNSKLKTFIPSFTYTPLEQTIKRVCAELTEKNKLVS